MAEYDRLGVPEVPLTKTVWSVAMEYPLEHPERGQMLTWLAEELPYVDSKWDPIGTDDSFIVEGGMSKKGGVGPDSYFFEQVMQYLQRADTLGLDTPQGKQAVGKALGAMTGLVETVIRVYGSLPRGGVASGEIIE